MKKAFITRQGWVLLSVNFILGLCSSYIGRVDLPIPLPGLSTASSSLPVPAIFAVLMVVVGLWCVEQGERDWMVASVRSARLFSGGMLGVSLLSCFLVALAVSSVAFDMSSAVLLGRNMLAFGLFSLVAWQFGSSTFAGVGSAVWVAFCCLFARDSSGGVRWWAWCLNRDSGDVWAWCFSGLCVVVLVLRYRFTR